jgi:hypothetical protein
MKPTMKKLTRIVWKPPVTLKVTRSMLSWVSTISSPGPQIGDAGVKLEKGICKVKKTRWLIKLTIASP